MSFPAFDTLTWLRPWWLLAILPLALLAAFIWLGRLRAGGWDRVVDPALQEHVLIAGSDRKRHWRWLPAVFWLLLIITLAGPVWEQRPVPAYQALQSQVIALDLSLSMNADDVLPSRLARARHKLADILEASSGRQTGLVVFSNTAYVISPLTDDADTLQAFFPALETDVMPVQGSRVALAIAESQRLLSQSAQNHGDILLITDATVSARDIDTARQAREQGARVSVLAVATQAGQPVPLPDGSFLKNSQGQIVVAQLDADGLQQLADAGGGRYAEIASDDTDLARLLGPGAVAATEMVDQSLNDSEVELISWIEYAPWLLLALLPLAALLFRRGVL